MQTLLLNKGFWVVTEPTIHSTLSDIVFWSDRDKMMLQFAGGLTWPQISMITDDHDRAIRHARELLER